MKSKFKIDHNAVIKNIETLQKYLADNDIHGMYISSFDYFLNEYVPLWDCHRYYVTGFSGSVAEAFLYAEGKVQLFVDGRYFEQADLEVPLSHVEVVKCQDRLSQELIKKIENLSLKKIAYESARTPLSFQEVLSAQCQVLIDCGHDIEELLTKPEKPHYGIVDLVEEQYRGDHTAFKLERIFKDHKEKLKTNQGYFITAIDTIAWLTNCRGYHLPFLSSFLAQALVVHDNVFLFHDSEIEISGKAKSEPHLNFVPYESKTYVSALKNQLQLLQNRYQLEELMYDPQTLNCRDFALLEDVFSKNKLRAFNGGLIQWQALKDSGEQREMHRSFVLASKAIYNTIMWTKNNIKNNQDISEWDLYQQTSLEYQKQGARTQSFNTISGVGPNGSIIHYSAPKKEIKIQADDMVLLDSGGYFEGGFATDTTRTFLAGAFQEIFNNSIKFKKYQKMYTLVCRAFIQCHQAIFLPGTLGNQLDFLTRQPLFQEGLNYAHGTGHGVGIHVHEGGTGISFRPNVLKPGHAVSIEPGLYEPGFAGVRIENVALVQEHPKFKGYLYFEPLTLVGLDHDLIDKTQLTESENEWLMEYEKKCKTIGTSFTLR
jgi:Xaa-Pro aminopeptidase